MAERKAKFTYGDRVQRKTGGRVETVCDVGPGAYYFESGQFALLEDEDCYVIVEQSSGYFRVDANLTRAPLDRHIEHGYEDRNEFRNALNRLIELWGGRVGEQTETRNKFLRLRFHDTPGGKADEAWLPIYLLRPCSTPEYMKPESKKDPFIDELDEAFGFD